MSSASSRAVPSRKAGPPAAALVLQPAAATRPASRTADDIVAAHLAQDELELAVATLLPLLEGGSGIERQAATVVRQLLARSAAAVPAPAPAEHHLVGALRRMADLLQRQERQAAQLEAMLDGLA